jgi:hypothetical protein
MVEPKQHSDLDEKAKQHPLIIYNKSCILCILFSNLPMHLATYFWHRSLCWLNYSNLVVANLREEADGTTKGELGLMLTLCNTETSIFHLLKSEAPHPSASHSDNQIHLHEKLYDKRFMPL